MNDEFVMGCRENGCDRQEGHPGQHLPLVMRYGAAPDRNRLAALERLVDAIQATDWDHGAAGAEIAAALVQARVAILAMPKEQE